MARRPSKKAASRRGSGNAAGGSRFHRGEEGRRRSVTERERQQKQRDEAQSGNRVFRFYVPVGETKEFIVLDDEPDFFMWEHNYKGSDGRYGHLAGCCKEWENCPACEETGSQSYYAMFLTVIDLSEYTDKHGNEVEFSRKLMCVKLAQQSKFMRTMERNGSLRGAKFETTRDRQLDSAIGNDIEFIEMVPEDELQEYVREWEDRDGKVHEEDCFDAYDYEEIFEEPTPENIAKQVGVEYEPAVGSAESDRRLLDEDAEDEEEPRRRISPRRGRSDSGKSSSRRKARDVEEDDDMDSEQDDQVAWDEEEVGSDEEAPRTRRGATRGSSRSTRRSRR